MGIRSTLPTTPSRNDVASTLQSLRQAIRCHSNDQHGTANTTVTVSGARLTRFQRCTFGVSFPYRI